MFLTLREGRGVRAFVNRVLKAMFVSNRDGTTSWRKRLNNGDICIIRQIMVYSVCDTE
jgi:hypothetical protein